MLRYACPLCRAEYDEPPPRACTRDGMPLHRRPDGWAGYSLDYSPKEPRIVSALDMRSRRWDTRMAGRLMSQIVGPTLPATIAAAFSGPPGSGKSSLVTSIAEDGTWQRPLMVCAEEGLSRSVADRLGRAEALCLMVTDARDIPSVQAAIRRAEADLLVVDSATALGLSPEEALGFKRLGVSVLCTLQVLKDGTHAGSMAWLHDLDLHVSMDSLHWKVEKSWLGAEKREGRL